MIRKFTRNRKIYANEESAVKLVFMAIREASKKWTCLLDLPNLQFGDCHLFSRMAAQTQATYAADAWGSELKHSVACIFRFLTPLFP
jgi:hypothetical protein